MNLDRRTIINTIIEADELLLSADSYEVAEERAKYGEMSDQLLVVELISTLKLANRQVRFLENRITQLTGINK